MKTVRRFVLPTVVLVTFCALAFQTACPAPRIPAASGGMTILLALLLAAALAWMLRRRRIV